MESVMDIDEKEYDKDIEYSSALMYFLSKKCDKYSTKCGMKKLCLIKCKISEIKKYSSKNLV